MKRHPFDPISFVLGLAAVVLGLYFLSGDRSVADIGAQWLWPLPVLLVGLVAVLYAVRRMLPVREPLPDDASEGEDEAHGPNPPVEPID